MEASLGGAVAGDCGHFIHCLPLQPTPEPPFEIVQYREHHGNDDEGQERRGDQAADHGVGHGGAHFGAGAETERVEMDGIKPDIDFTLGASHQVHHSLLKKAGRKMPAGI